MWSHPQETGMGVVTLSTLWGIHLVAYLPPCDQTKSMKCAMPSLTINRHWFKWRFGMMHIYYKMMMCYLFIEPMIPLHCILNHERAISAESASTTQSCSFELCLHWVRFEPSIELKNCEDESRSKSHKSHHHLILHMEQQSLMLRGLSLPTVCMWFHFQIQNCPF
jgi:hypothetical protein